MSRRKPKGDRPFEGYFESYYTDVMKKRSAGLPLPEALDTWFENATPEEAGGMSEAKMPLGKHFHPQRSRGPTKG